MEIVDSPFSVQEIRKGKDYTRLYLAAIQSAKKAYQLSQHLHSKRIVVRDFNYFVLYYLQIYLYEFRCSTFFKI